MGYCTLRSTAGEENALTHAMYQSLADALNSANSDASIRTILFSGAGDDFCSGNDLRDFLDNPPMGESAPVFKFIFALANAEKPIVASVNGLAIGIGTTMLLHCDIVYADTQALFSIPFVKLGVCLEAGLFNVVAAPLRTAESGGAALTRHAVCGGRSVGYRV